MINDISYLEVRDFSFLLLKLVDIFIEELKDEIELVIFFDKLKKLYNIWMMEFADNSYLIQIYALIPIFIVSLHSLNGYDLPCLLVDTLGDATKASITKFVAQFVFLHFE